MKSFIQNRTKVFLKILLLYCLLSVSSFSRFISNFKFWEMKFLSPLQVTPPTCVHMSHHVFQLTYQLYFLSRIKVSPISGACCLLVTLARLLDTLSLLSEDSEVWAHLLGISSYASYASSVFDRVYVVWCWITCWIKCAQHSVPDTVCYQDICLTRWPHFLEYSGSLQLGTI